MTSPQIDWLDSIDSPITLRDYQRDAFDSIINELHVKGRRSTLLNMATGLGKTSVFAKIARHEVERLGGSVLVLAHRRELIEQACDRFSDIGVISVIEKAESDGYRQVMDTDAKVVVGSIATMKGGRLAKWPDMFSLIIVDECHRALAKGYIDIFSHFESAKILGVTATPYRMDGRNLGKVFESTAYTMSLRQGILDGWLSRIKAVKANARVDLRGLKKQAGDFSIGDLEDRIMPIVEFLANETVSVIGNRKTIIFTPDVRSAHAIASAMNQVGVRSCAVDGGSKDRSDIMDSFRASEFQCLVNCNLVVEGVDIPDVECIVLLRPTMSIGNLMQMCLDENTEILTERGWVGPDSILSSDRAAAFDLGDGSIRWSKIKSTVDRQLGEGEEFFGISSPSLDIKVTDRHNMVRRIVSTNKADRGPWELVEAKELADEIKCYEIPVSGLQPSSGVPLTDDEIKFIGWLMTDGCVSKKDGTATITQDHRSPYVADIESCIIGCGFKYRKKRVTRSTNFSDNSTMVVFTVCKGKPKKTDKHLSGWGRLEPYFHKDLSPLMDDMSRSQLLTLINEMNKGNGIKPKAIYWTQKTINICSGRRLLVDRMQSLCVRRGFRCNVSEGGWNKSPIYFMHIKDEASRYVGGRNYKDRPILGRIDGDNSKRVWCVEVDTGAIVTRRNGKVAIVGNCGRGTRIVPGKEYLLVVDWDWQIEDKNALCYVEELIADVNIPKRAAVMADSGRKGEDEPIDVMESLDRGMRRHEELVVIEEKIKVVAKPKSSMLAWASFDPVTSGCAIANVKVPNDYERRNFPASDKQIAALIGYGIEADEAREMTKRSAGQMLGWLSSRSNKGLATYKQVRMLVKNRVPKDEALSLTLGEASKRIDNIIRRSV